MSASPYIKPNPLTSRVSVSLLSEAYYPYPYPGKIKTQLELTTCRSSKNLDNRRTSRRVSVKSGYTVKQKRFEVDKWNLFQSHEEDQTMVYNITADLVFPTGDKYSSKGSNIDLCGQYWKEEARKGPQKSWARSSIKGGCATVDARRTQIFTQNNGCEIGLFGFMEAPWCFSQLLSRLEASGSKGQRQAVGGMVHHAVSPFLNLCFGKLLYFLKSYLVEEPQDAPARPSLISNLLCLSTCRRTWQARYLADSLYRNDIPYLVGEHYKCIILSRFDIFRDRDID
ncbi:uncharacterized protein BDR25DRAFT_356784 [Lindgomyces ingoldianus]|uniref:Uncharacterized protein n=1 Tax=Lindgomyces ingoldianus TaxID=673940 RepID=A0ACB6QPS0_9PLEO|nr:uncharacterized protein BDR25DRAFT_356784 [Lindgomyces ingoldianus]KAF2469019.1 hypothetical protein BDR25DRAFT_356784 [Lindgomyces ingoldianus]